MRRVSELLEQLRAIVVEGVEVNVREFEREHGKRPGGKGSWAFKFDADDEDIFWANGKYGDALKQAKEEAKARGASMISVLP